MNALQDPSDPSSPTVDLRLSPHSAEQIQVEVEKAGGREVCFLARVGPDRVLLEPRAVARGNKEAVLAAARDAEEGSVMIHNHPSGVLEPSEADLGVAARLYEEGIGTAITNNAANRLFVVVEPPKPRVVVPLDVDEVEALIGPSGPLAREHPAYEERPGQRAMLRRVAEAYNDGGVTLVEAGTGTGKSLAYLVPAAQWALQNTERTVISTNTINLQEQLDSKDLPLVRRLVGEDVDWELVKGRGNYVSIRRARLAVESAPLLFEDDRADELDQLIAWIGQTEDGSRADLTYVPSEDVWDEVKSDADICLRARCPHFQACFYQRSRRRAASAKLLITNHHLLFTDLSVRIATQNYKASAVLPAYRHVVLDEAHNIEDAATSHLGLEVTRRGMFRMLSRLDRRGRGILSAVQEGLAGSTEGDTATELRSRIEERVRPALADARAQLTLFLDALEPLLPSEVMGAVRIGTADMPEPASHPRVRERLDGLSSAFRVLGREIRHVRERLEYHETLADGMEGRLLDLRSAERRLADSAHTLHTVLDADEEEMRFVRWLECRGKSRGKNRNLVIASAPVEVGALLREHLFERADSVVLCSATLATKESFGFLKSRIGLRDEDLSESYVQLDMNESIIQSPFRFEEQTMLLVPTDLPDVNGPQGELEQATAAVIEEMCSISGGGTFVLFTSHRALRRVAELLREDPAGPWPIFVQGEDTRARLLERFIEAGSGIILGTASFWEGVDVPGRALRGLIIQRLPFKVPTEPVTASRIEAIERRGGSSFAEFVLPLAALKLKQGFGRLVRSQEDRGAILILDDRIVRKTYGAYLRESLPPAPLKKGPWADLVPLLREFYAMEGATSE
ncbi:MAG TPA: DEAD/DEAH box helicase [Gemmatimonadetes bacterium]|nr:DEAD/DEAH box helicase [Gemmatimonadota bacterium]